MKLQKLMDLMNYNLHARVNGNNSRLGDIEKSLTDIFVTTELTQDKIDQFEANLISNKNVFGDDSSKYEDLKGVNGYFNEMVAAKEMESSKGINKIL